MKPMAVDSKEAIAAIKTPFRGHTRTVRQGIKLRLSPPPGTGSNDGMDPRIKKVMPSFPMDQDPCCPVQKGHRAEGRIDLPSLPRKAIASVVDASINNLTSHVQEGLPLTLHYQNAADSITGLTVMPRESPALSLDLKLPPAFKGSQEGSKKRP